VYVDHTDREYIWTPGGAASGYVDEAICEITTANTPQYILQDANYNVVGLLSAVSSGSGGNVLCQVAYDPYGEPVVAEHLASHADLRLGHQGLFLDRLDLLGDGTLDMASPPGGTQYTLAAPTDGLGIKALYQNRNRTYSPGLGRFLQRDPKDLGAPEAMTSAIHGRPSSTSLELCNPDQIASDGSNLYQHVGSNSVNALDPSGLDGFIGAMMTGMDMADMASDAMDQAYQGVRMAFGLYSMLDNYLTGQMIDAEWADNWSWTDDWYSPGLQNAGASARYSDSSGPAMASGRISVGSRTHGLMPHNLGIRAMKPSRKRYGRPYSLKCPSRYLRSA
jgi:hypothetical protein